MAVTHQEVNRLCKLVIKERGDRAVHYVDRQINKLRRDGDEESALLWSMVLANLYHQQRQPMIETAQPADLFFNV